MRTEPPPPLPQATPLRNCGFFDVVQDAVARLEVKAAPADDPMLEFAAPSPAPAGPRKRRVAASVDAVHTIEVPDGWGSPNVRHLQVMQPNSSIGRQKCKGLWLLAEDVPFAVGGRQGRRVRQLGRQRRGGGRWRWRWRWR